MTTEELKQEAIKKAYGIHWELVEGYTDQNGWVENEIHKFTFGQLHGLDTEYRNNTQFRPKSLSGLESNNGWIRIEEDGSNLPITEGLFHSGKLNNNEFVNYDRRKSYDVRFLFEMGSITHYQPIIHPNPPIF